MIRLRHGFFRFLAVCLSSGLPAATGISSPSIVQSAQGIPGAAPASQSAIEAPGLTRRPDYQFPLGQTFVYSAQWRVFNAGVATLRVEQAGQQNRVVGTANAIGSAALLYHVQDKFESFLDPATFCSHSTSRQVEEGFRRVNTSITFDYQRAKAIFDQRNLKKNESKHLEHDIGGCVTDMLSGIYYAASLPLQPGRNYTIPLNDGGATILVNLHVEAREQIKTPAGTFNTLRVQPEATTGLLKDKGKIWIWYSDDAARIPVQMRGRMYWGTLTLVLQRIDRK